MSLVLYMVWVLVLGYRTHILTCHGRRCKGLRRSGLVKEGPGEGETLSPPRHKGHHHLLRQRWDHGTAYIHHILKRKKKETITYLSLGKSLMRQVTNPSTNNCLSMTLTPFLRILERISRSQVNLAYCIQSW